MLISFVRIKLFVVMVWLIYGLLIGLMVDIEFELEYRQLITNKKEFSSSSLQDSWKSKTLSLSNPDSLLHYVVSINQF